MEEIGLIPSSPTTWSSSTTHASKKRKYNDMGSERIVVAVKIQGNGKKQTSGGSPSDCCSWRKYGQKPIKGSPYPRGYYRCSTSKNCSAKKQVERCRTDATTLIITYTCAHNHPQPDNIHPCSNQKQQQPESKHVPTESAEHSKFTFSSPDQDHLVEENPFPESDNLQRPPLLEIKTEENDFYDELEELPTSSFFTALMRSDFCDTRILLNPS